MRKTRKLLSILMSLAMLFAMCPATFAAEETADAEDISKSVIITMQITNPVMTVNGVDTAIDESGITPIVQNGSTLLPVRSVVEAMGGTVDWNNKTKIATLTCGEDVITLTIGSNTATLNGDAQKIPVAPTIINNKTMLPIRFVAESFGAQVGWDNATKTVTISSPGVPAELRTMYDQFISAVDPDYAYQIALQLSTNTKFQDSALGGRNAGSDAEHAAADWLLTQMKSIGLKNTEKVAADCDKWQFNGATFTVDGKSYDVYSYATSSTSPGGINAEIVYLDKGTAYDYEGIDVKGKIVLVDIDQRADWWITYPMLEAQFQGAAAILASNVGGFSQIADDALNAQDICAPTGIPCLSIGVSDANEIKAKIKSGVTTAKLVVDNQVEIDKGTTYNIMGKIPGKNSENQIIIGGHYDMHFIGFQDDNCAVGLVLAMAKAMIDSEYVPENDIIFCLHGAEEWGSSNTQYDWTVGAWEMINNVHPEWVGKTLAFINFELPAYEFDTYTSTYSAPEMYSMIDYFAKTYLLSPDPVNCFPDGVLTKGYQTYTYSDDFSYYAAGVPSTVNGFLLQENMEDVFDFYVDIYHSQYDEPSTYNEAVMNFNIEYYGALAMYIDQMPALYLDFTAQYDRILASIDTDTMVSAGVNVANYKNVLGSLKTAAEALTAKTEATNDAYIKAWIDGDTAAMTTLKAEGKKLTKQNLEAFKFAQKAFLGLMYEKPIVPHEAPQENIILMQSTIDSLKTGDVVTATDEYAWMVNNVLEWYSMYFSPEVIAIQDAMFWGADNQDNLYWGTDRNFVKAGVEDASRSLFLRYDEVNGDFTKEIAIYQEAINVQTKLLKTLSEQEIANMVKLTTMLK